MTAVKNQRFMFLKEMMEIKALSLPHLILFPANRVLAFFCFQGILNNMSDRKLPTQILAFISVPSVNLKALALQTRAFETLTSGREVKARISP